MIYTAATTEKEEGIFGPVICSFEESSEKTVLVYGFRDVERKD